MQGSWFYTRLFTDLSTCVNKRLCVYNIDHIDHCFQTSEVQRGFSSWMADIWELLGNEIWSHLSHTPTHTRHTLTQTHIPHIHTHSNLPSTNQNPPTHSSSFTRDFLHFLWPQLSFNLMWHSHSFNLAERSESWMEGKEHKPIIKGLFWA